MEFYTIDVLIFLCFSIRYELLTKIIEKLIKFMND